MPPCPVVAPRAALSNDSSGSSRSISMRRLSCNKKDTSQRQCAGGPAGQPLQTRSIPAILLPDRIDVSLPISAVGHVSGITILRLFRALTRLPRIPMRTHFISTATTAIRARFSARFVGRGSPVKAA